MLELTLTTGTELKIGDDIRIIFRGDTTTGRMKVAVEAPREKRIERIKVPEEQKEYGKVLIVKGDRRRRKKPDEECAETGSAWLHK